ncbi:MAG: WD40/YVTN/BNR-like repeat-containing protein, partial [Flavobacteriaceae bacterium]
ASGGLWKSTSGGIDWTPLFQDQVTASIGAIAIQQSNPDVIWIGTGEGNPRNSLNGGYGVYRSLDAGKTWQSMGLEKTRHIHRIIVDPTNPNVVYVAAIGSPWGEHPERGIFKTSDAGKTWEKIVYVNTKTGAADLIMDPTNPNKLIAALWEHKRDPWFFKSGGEGSGLYITVDGGKNWVKKTSKEGLPEGELGRIGLAMAHNKPNVVYALIEAKKNALYKSTDGGDTWMKVNDKPEIGNRPFYYSDLFVDPQNENRLYSVFTYVNVSEDGGKSFTSLMPAYNANNGIHPDHHALWIHPEDGSFMIDGNDGGLNITRDGGASWQFVGNIPVGQFYHVSVDLEYPYNVYGGMQDNGSWRGPAYVWKAQGIRNSYWQEIAFGDGFDVVPDRDDSRFGYAMSQQGNVSRYDWQTGNNYGVRPTHPDPNMVLRFNWNAAIGQDPFDNSTVYFGSQFVHKSSDKGLTWEVISPDLTTNDPEKQKQSESGGLTLDATGAENHCTLLVIEPSPIQKDLLWTGSDDGRVHITLDGGKNWTEVSQNLKSLPKGSWIAQIKASNKAAGTAFLVANDYRRFNYTPYVFKTTNYGKSWERIVDENDVFGYTLSIVEDIEAENLLFLGTDDGLYYSLNAGKKWTKFDSKVFPTVSTKDLVIHPREHDLVIGTFGRAIWVMDDIRPLRALANNPELLTKESHLFDPPTAYMAAYQQPTGSRFGGDALYNAENRRYGSMMTYFYKVSDEKSKDSLTLKIYDGERLIRTLKSKAPKTTGFHRWYWNMDEKGVNRPSRSDRRRQFESSGVSVKPGTYKVVLESKSSTTETSVTVLTDPRLVTSQQSIDDQYNYGKKIEALTEKATEAVDQLKASKKILASYKNRIESKDKKANAELLSTIATHTKTIDEILDVFLGKEDNRQGIVRNPEISVMRRISQANSYIRSRPSGITSTEEKLLAHATQDLKSALEQTNAFYQEHWDNLKSKIEAVELSEFEEVKQFDTLIQP